MLVAPLDWGLGLATRCVPLIKELLRQNCTVLLAASGRGKALLQQEFPALPMLHLPGYEIEYAASGWGLAVKIVAQIPKLFDAIKEEQAWLQKVVAEQRIDAVISDNRYGLFHPQVRSVLMTHQLCIKVPLKLAEDLLQETVYQYINRFHECWVPDAEGEPNLAGDLSHPQNLPSIPVFYTGPLSRFAAQTTTEEDYLLVLLSGPEPQRSLLEQRLVEDLKGYTGPVVLVRGLPGLEEEMTVAENVTVFHHLPAAELEAVVRKASMVISRSGYSTVMDLSALQKRSILIPTPGQTEQEYLARHLMKQNLAFCVEQNKFRLKQVLAMASQFSYHPFAVPQGSALQTTIRRFLLSLSTEPIQV